MKTAELIDDIRVYCRANADKKVVAKYSRYFTEGYDAYGLSREKYEAEVQSLIRDNKVTMKQVLSAAKPLIQSGKYEETSFAIGLLKEFADQFDEKTFKKIEQWFTWGIINWAHCDVLCGFLITPLLEKKLITHQDFADWRRAQNTYQRRAVPVAMLPLLKTAKRYGPLFKFIDPLMMDSEKKVQQGLGWFLREAWKIKPKETEIFLMKWKDQAPRTIFQYATEKMTPAEKQKFRKSNNKGAM